MRSLHAVTAHDLKLKGFFTRSFPAIGVALFVIALVALHHVLKQYRYHETATALGNIPRTQLVLSLVLAALGYLCLTSYDALGFCN